MNISKRIRFFLAIGVVLSAFAMLACPPTGGDVTAPTILSTTPASGATEVPVPSSITATFSEEMDAATMVAANFTLAGGAAVAGVVTYADEILTFDPDANLEYGVTYTATIGVAVKDISGNAMAEAKTWSFATPAVPDITAPTVSGRFPAVDATGVFTMDNVTVTFSEAMDQATITDVTFTLAAGATPVTGVVSYSGLVATFNPASDLAVSTVYTATVTTGAKDAAGNALAAPVTWSFTTGDMVLAANPSAVPLLTSGNYVILAQSQITNVPTSDITGDMGLSPAAESGITGFVLTDVLDGLEIEYATTPQVTGRVYAADMAGGTPTTASNLTTAIEDKLAAYNDAFNRATPDYLNIGGGTISGHTFSRGLYRWDSALNITGDITLTGNATDIFIFQVVGALHLSSAKSVILAGGALPENIFWQVSGVATLNTTSVFKGVILCAEDIQLLTGSTLDGRALAKKQVILQSATVTEPAP